MRTRRLLLPLLAFHFAVPAAGGETLTNPLKEFASKEGGFSVLLPVAPREQKSPLAGTSEFQHQFSVSLQKGTYLVSYQDNPNLARSDTQSQSRALMDGQRAVQAAFPGRILSEKTMKLGDDNPGRAFELEIMHGQGLLRERMYLVKTRLYQLIVIGAGDFVGSKDAETFLGSFKLLRP